MKFNLSSLLFGLAAASVVSANKKQRGDYFEDDLDETTSHQTQGQPKKMCDKDGAIQAQMGLLMNGCDVKEAIAQIQSIFTNGFAYNQMTQVRLSRERYKGTR